MSKIKLITIDVWDTLLRRTCHPDDVKLHTCQYIFKKYSVYLKPKYCDLLELLKARQEAEHEIGLQNKTIGLDDEYKIIEVIQLWSSKIAITQNNFFWTAEELHEIELAQECRVTYQDPEILKHLDQYKGIEIIFVSDFYMGSKDICKILTKNSLSSTVQRGYSSSDVYLNKRSGRLFNHVLISEGLNPSEVIHIGDNIHSDVNSPKNHGIMSTHYLPKIQHELRMRKEKSFYQFKEITQETIKKAKEKLNYTNDLHDKDYLMHQIGIDNSSLIVGFALFVMEKAIILGHKKIFFFTREGEFFKQVYDILASQNPFSISPPESELLEVSRISTFSASLEDITLKSLMRLWNLYSSQSLQALFSSLNVDTTQFLDFTNKYNLNLDENIQYPWLDKRINLLFEDADFKYILTNQLESKRKSLLGYLETKKLLNLSNVAIVDIGWRGTIQDNLAHLLPKINIDGFYLGLDKYLNVQPANVRKYAFGPDLNTSDLEFSYLLNRVAPIEMLCNSPNGSVVGYYKNNGIYSAKRLIVESENVSYQNFVDPFQKGVIFSAEIFGDVIRRHVVPVEIFREFALDNWSKICLQPSELIAEAYFNINHNESFGLGRFSDKSSIIKIDIWLKGLLTPKGFKQLVTELEGTGWPEGYLSKRGLRWFWSIVKFARYLYNKKFDARLKKFLN
jgi:predicted HAD superfamily hydrolase